jgi:hypothetical protein
MINMSFLDRLFGSSPSPKELIDEDIKSMLLTEETRDEETPCTENDKEDIHEENDSDIYVISVDGVPEVYSKDLKTAQKTMWSLARHLFLNSSANNYTVPTYVQVSDVELRVFGYSKYFLLSYETELYRITINSISETH